MIENGEQSALPRWRATRWLVETKGDIREEIQPSLVKGLYGGVPIFLGGVVNTIAVSTLIGLRIPTIPFLIWAAIEIALACVRLPLLIHAHRAIARGARPRTDLYIALAVAWAASVGYGALISLVSGDFVASTLACLSAAAMAGGIAFRNFSAPRLVAVMIALSLGPCMIGGFLSGEPILSVIALQIPAYGFAVTLAAFRLHGLLVRTMESEHANRQLALHDPLTGLRNRAGLEEEVERRLALSDVHGQTVLLYLDLDGFKSVNDTYGHAAGDALLRQLAHRLRNATGPDDLVARIGGDEFVVVTSGLDAAAAVQAGERISAELSRRPYDLGRDTARVGASVGLAVHPIHGCDFETLFSAADVALYQAKAVGSAACFIAATPPPASRAEPRRARAYG